MAEIALRTTEFLNRKAKYTAWRPVGSVIIAISRSMMRRKWCEIVCDLMRPDKRERFRGVPGYERLCQAWSRELWEAWFEFSRPSPDWPMGRMLMDQGAPAEFWNRNIVPLGIVNDLPQAPEADMSVADTWLWSEKERKRYFIVVSAAGQEVEDWQNHEEVTHISLGRILHPRKMLDYPRASWLSADSVAKIQDAGQVCHPKFHRPVAVAEFLRPDAKVLKA